MTAGACPCHVTTVMRAGVICAAISRTGQEQPLHTTQLRCQNTPQLARLQEPLVRHKVHLVPAVQAMRRGVQAAVHVCLCFSGHEHFWLLLSAWSVVDTRSTVLLLFLLLLNGPSSAAGTPSCCCIDVKGTC